MHETDDLFKDLEIEGSMDEMDEDNVFREPECCLQTLKEKQPGAIDSGATTFLDVDSDVSQPRKSPTRTYLQMSLTTTMRMKRKKNMSKKKPVLLTSYKCDQRSQN